MAKEDEIAYVARIGELGREHALNKPWSDVDRGRYLQEIGALLSLLPAPPARLLDAGAGSGWTSALFALSGYRVTATDISPEMVELMKLNAARYRVELEGTVVSDFESLAFDNEFDVVVFYDCLHHSDDEVAALTSAYRALKPGGMCVTLEPGIGHHKAEISIAAMQNLGVTERDMPPRLIIDAGRKAGFREFEIHERPNTPIQLAAGWAPRPKTLVRVTRRFVSQATPIARTLGHFVVLRK